MHEQSWVYEGAEIALTCRPTTEKTTLRLEMMVYSSL